MNDENGLLKKKSDEIIPMEKLIPKGNPVDNNTKPIVENNSQSINMNNQQINNNIQNNNMNKNQEISQSNNIHNEFQNNTYINNPNPITNQNNGLNNPQINNVTNNINYNGNGEQDNIKKSSVNKSALFSVFAIIVIIAGIYFIFFRDNQKKMICSHSEEYMSEEVTMYINSNNKVNKMKFVVTYDFTDLSDELKEMAKNEDACGGYKSDSDSEFEFTNCKKEVSGDKIIVKLDMKVKGSKGEDATISELRENIEKTGFTCTMN